MSLQNAFLAFQQERHLQSDPDQIQVLEAFTALETVLQTHNQKKSWWKKNKGAQHQGIYLWGSVGSGKTLLMDFFFNEIQDIPKFRIHFHGFMQSIHDKLTLLQGQVNPLPAIVKELSKTVTLLCLDEFFVENIVDAMLMAELFKALFEAGMFIVITSNTPPEALYQAGLARDRFLPTIKLLQEHLNVIKLAKPWDYRQQNAYENTRYYEHCDPSTLKNLWKTWGAPLPFEHLVPKEMLVCERLIRVEYADETLLWCKFNVLCGHARSKMDYLALSTSYKRIILTHIPRLGAEELPLLIRFCSLIDVIYDAGIELILAADYPFEAMQDFQVYLKVFTRTYSRLYALTFPPKLP